MIFSLNLENKLNWKLNYMELRGFEDRKDSYVYQFIKCIDGRRIHKFDRSNQFGRKINYHWGNDPH